mgnify:CR=1 FL=1
MDTRKKKLIGIFAFVLLVSLLLACGKPKATPTPEPTATFTPTNTPMPTNTSVPTNTPAPTAIPTKAQPPTPTKAPAVPTPTKQTTVPPTDTSALPKGLVVLSHTGFVDQDGSVNIVGQVLNNDSINYQYIEIKATLTDKEGKFLAEESTYVYVDILEPGQKSPFRLTIWEPPANLDKYELAASGTKTNDKPVAGLEFVQVFDQGNKEDNSWTLIGEVKYTGAQIIESPKIAVTLYDADGNVVDTGFAYAERSLMTKDKISPFELYISNVHGKPTRYEAVISGSIAPQWQIEKAAQVELTDIDYYIDSFGDLVIVGEVKNADQSNVEYIKVFASIYDKSDKLVAVGWSYAWADILRPGEVSPFKIDIFDTPPEADHWTVWVQGTKTEEQPVGNLVFANVDHKLENGIATFSGTIRNDGKETMEYIEVAVTIYDKEGKVVMVDWDWLEGELAPKGTMDFEFDVKVPDTATNFELYVKGSVKE